MTPEQLRARLREMRKRASRIQELEDALEEALQLVVDIDVCVLMSSGSEYSEKYDRLNSFLVGDNEKFNS